MQAGDCWTKVASVFLLALACSGAAGSGEGPEEKPADEDLITRLRLQTEQVRSCECEFSMVVVPTEDPDLEQKIEEALRLRGEPPIPGISYKANPEAVKLNSIRAKWWRKGLKERWEIEPYYKDPTSTKLTIRAFNGKRIVTLAEKNGERTGSLDTPENAHWFNVNRLHPFSMMFESYGHLNWKLLAEHSGGKPERIVKDGETWIKASFIGPDSTHRRVDLLYDGNYRLRERWMFNYLPPETQRRLYQKHIFYDFREIRAADGVVIAFPHRAEYVHYMGVLADGSLVQTWTDSFTIHRVEFNVEIPDAMFELELPKGIPIYDSIHTKGWINGPREEVGPRIKSRVTTYLLVNALLIAVLATAGAILYYRYRYRRPAARPSP